VFEKNFSLMQVYGADEAFVTGTFAGLTPVFEVDGRTMAHAKRGPMVDRLQSLYKALVVSESALPENCGD
jgi:branched-chain amino acid aminotransferase